NYYVVRANALEDNVRLYHVIRGRRSQFAGADTKVRSGVWQTLRLRIEGAQFQVHFEGKVLFEASDSRLPAPGRIGLWTKANSVHYFAQFDHATIAAEAGGNEHDQEAKTRGRRACRQVRPRDPRLCSDRRHARNAGARRGACAAADLGDVDSARGCGRSNRS